MVAYQPSALKNKNTKGFTGFEQQERYFESHGDGWSPRTIFYKELVAQLRIWCQQEEEIILCGDFNEHMYEGRLAQWLGQDDIRMSETYYQTTNERLPPIHVTVSRPIDAVYATVGVSSINATILKSMEELGIIEFLSSTSPLSLF